MIVMGRKKESSQIKKKWCHLKARAITTPAPCKGHQLQGKFIITDRLSKVNNYGVSSKDESLWASHYCCTTKENKNPQLNLFVKCVIYIRSSVKRRLTAKLTQASVQMCPSIKVRFMATHTHIYKYLGKFWRASSHKKCVLSCTY